MHQICATLVFSFRSFLPPDTAEIGVQKAAITPCREWFDYYGKKYKKVGLHLKI